MPAESNKTRKFHLPDEQEYALINAGIAADDNTYERNSEGFKQLKRGRGRINDSHHRQSDGE